MTASLLAEIGGTYARFALSSGDRPGPIHRLQVARFPDAQRAFRHFLDREAGSAAIERAVVAAAGPVSDGRCKLTNADWTLDGEALKREFGFASARIVNDLEALAWALPRLAPSDCVQVGRGHAMAGQPMAVISPGTGLGMACFVPGEARPALPGEAGRAVSGERGHVLPSEGGHATVAAFDRETEAAIAVLRERYGHVSAERVLSGAGVANLYQAVAELDGVTTETPAPEHITRDGMNGSSERARRALDLFCALLGSVAGDMALTFGARGGVHLGGGIVPALVDYLPRSRFRAAFESKGRLRAYMEQVPTRVIVRPDPAFLGLAALASTRRAERRES